MTDQAVLGEGIVADLDVDIAIVGYGPIGQSLAILLGNSGWRVAVYDKQPGLYPLPRACHLDHEAMRILQSMGLAQQIDAAIAPAREYRLLAADLSVLSDLPRGWKTPTGWESSYHFYQPDVEGIFDDAAKQTVGVQVTQGAEVIALEDRGDDVIITVAHADERQEHVRARFVIGADGANSFVRRAVNIGQQDLGFAATWVVNDVRVRDGQPAPDVPDTGQVLDPAQPRHMAWLGGQHYRWEFMLADGDDPIANSAPDAVWQRLQHWVDPSTADLLRSAPYTFRSLVADDFRAGRVLLAGDAAHTMPPFMGQGMVSGMRDAVTLAWMLDLVLRGVTDAEFLDTYTASRRPHVLAFIEQSMEVGTMVCETDPVRAAERDKRLRAQTDTPPPFQPSLTAFVGAHPAAGSLAQQPRSAVDGRLMADAIGTGFAVISQHSLVGELSRAARHLLDDLDASVAVVVPEGTSGAVGEFVEADAQLTTWFSENDADWIIVRPDGYLADAGVGAAALESSLGWMAEALHPTEAR